MADIVTIQTPLLGDRSYLVTHGATAFVENQRRDIDRVLALAASRGGKPRGHRDPRVRDLHP